METVFTARIKILHNGPVDDVHNADNAVCTSIVRPSDCYSSHGTIRGQIDVIGVVAATNI